MSILFCCSYIYKINIMININIICIMNNISLKKYDDAGLGKYHFGFEESYGCLPGTYARDKDAVVASQLVVEMAAYYKSKGKSLIDVMNDIYAKYGNYLNRVDNFAFEGASGMQKMADIMDNIRNNKPTEIAGLKVLETTDYKETEKTGLPASNVLAFKLENGNGVVARPSGTEPKLKIYFTAVANTMDAADALYKDMLESAKKWLEV